MKIRISQLTAAAVVAFLVHSFALGQARQTPVKEPAILLAVLGEVEHPLKLSQADLAKLPHVTVRAKDHDGKDVDFEGVALAEILRLASVPAGEQLRGKNLALYLVVEAADGYRALFALAELDPGFSDRVVLLAEARDGKPLSSSEGRLRIIVPNEKRQARWVRQVISFTIRRA